MGFKLCPSSVRLYSTCGGTSAYTFRFTNPSDFIFLKLEVSTFWLTRPILRYNSPNLFAPGIKSRRIRTFHLLPINISAVSTGQDGNSLFATISPKSNLDHVLAAQWSPDRKKLCTRSHRYEEVFLPHGEPHDPGSRRYPPLRLRYR